MYYLDILQLYMVLILICKYHILQLVYKTQRKKKMLLGVQYSVGHNDMFKRTHIQQINNSCDTS